MCSFKFCMRSRRRYENIALAWLPKTLSLVLPQEKKVEGSTYLPEVRIKIEM